MHHSNVSNGPAAILLAALSLTAACDSPRYTESFRPEGDIARIVLEVDAGDVELIEGTSLQVERTIRGAEGAVELSHRIELEGDGAQTLTLVARCAALLPCSVDTRVTVPAGILVEVELTRGEVWASGIDALNLELDRGDADLSTKGPLSVRIGQGELMASLPADATARLAVGRGDITLQVPPGAWRVDAIASHLILDEQITDSQDASGELELVAPAGSVTVYSRQPLAGVR